MLRNIPTNATTSLWTSKSKTMAKRIVSDNKASGNIYSIHIDKHIMSSEKQNEAYRSFSNWKVSQMSKSMYWDIQVRSEV